MRVELQLSRGSALGEKHQKRVNDRRKHDDEWHSRETLEKNPHDACVQCGRVRLSHHRHGNSRRVGNAFSVEGRSAFGKTQRHPLVWHREEDGRGTLS